MKPYNPEVREQRIVKLQEKVEEFLMRIISPDMQQQMPLEIRAIAGFTAQFAAIYAPKQSYRALIGGFVMLRYLSPAIVTPEAYGLLGGNAAPSYRVRRNLILIAKLLQVRFLSFASHSHFLIKVIIFIRYRIYRMA